MNIALDTALMTATLTGDANSTPAIPIKAGSQEPVTVTCTAGGSPSTFTGTPIMSVGLSEGTGNNPNTLCWLDITGATDGVFTGQMDGTDTRLTTFLQNGPQTLNVECQLSINGGLPFVFPNMPVQCQQLQNPVGGSSPAIVTASNLGSVLANLMATGLSDDLPTTPQTLYLNGFLLAISSTGGSAPAGTTPLTGLTLLGAIQNLMASLPGDKPDAPGNLYIDGNNLAISMP